jgi:hypothetical protein
VSSRHREQLESHFLGCDDCRSFLALFARISDDMTDPDLQHLTDSEIKNQAAKIITYIKEDEFNRRTAEGNRQQVGAFGQGAFAVNQQGMIGRFFGSTRNLVSVGLMVCALAVGGYFLTRGEPTNVIVMDALATATKERRLVEPRLTGLPYSPFPAVLRGPEEGGDTQADLHFGRAQAAVEFAEDASAPAEDRLLLARVYLARGEAEYTRRALAILEQLSASGNQSPELLNDMGAALYQLGRYGEASAKFNQALDKSPGFNEALFNRAMTEQRIGNNAKAREDWNRFIETSSDERWKEEARRRLD